MRNTEGSRATIQSRHVMEILSAIKRLISLLPLKEFGAILESRPTTPDDYPLRPFFKSPESRVPIWKIYLFLNLDDFLIFNFLDSMEDK